jgi:hypothetical protein
VRPRASPSARVRALGAALLLAACTAPRPVDPLAQRCGEAVGYLNPDWSELRVAHSQRTAGGLAVRVRVEGVAEPDGARVTEYASCAFKSGERPSALRVVIGDRALDAKELALVNAELLLRDLGRGDV